ncbi:Uncharacterised protein [Mycobacterium tuberculosis]|nr:Uncharacterised protein [Mycobacterium tuberculosis]
MEARYARTLASLCQWSPGIFDNRLPLPWTTSSWLMGRT